MYPMYLLNLCATDVVKPTISMHRLLSSSRLPRPVLHSKHQRRLVAAGTHPLAHPPVLCRRQRRPRSSAVRHRGMDRLDAFAPFGAADDQAAADRSMRPMQGSVVADPKLWERCAGEAVVEVVLDWPWLVQELRVGRYHCRLGRA